MLEEVASKGVRGHGGNEEKCKVEEARKDAYEGRRFKRMRGRSSSKRLIIIFVNGGCCGHVQSVGMPKCP